GISKIRCRSRRQANATPDSDDTNAARPPGYATTVVDADPTLPANQAQGYGQLIVADAPGADHRDVDRAGVWRSGQQISRHRNLARRGQGRVDDGFFVGAFWN